MPREAAFLHEGVFSRESVTNDLQRVAIRQMVVEPRQPRNEGKFGELLARGLTQKEAGSGLEQGSGLEHLGAEIMNRQEISHTQQAEKSSAEGAPYPDGATLLASPRSSVDRAAVS